MSIASVRTYMFLYTLFEGQEFLRTNVLLDILHVTSNALSIR
jgi:hypothetical protein